MNRTDSMLDPEICERARRARDPRFDGRFFVAVRTTGIYCRPICPVRLPKPGNVHFFPSAAAAAEHGYRPCLRCRPELAPDNPYWPQHPPLVREALRRIAEGALDQYGVTQLAVRLGVTDRHLRRLFREHLGASPKALALSRRVLFAKQLISDSQLPLQQVATASGFGSVRRFNASFATYYGRPPGALRKQREASPEPGFALHLPYRPPYDWPQIRDFLAARAIAGLECVSTDRYQRHFIARGQAGRLSLGHEASRLRFRLSVEHSDPSVLYAVAERCKRLLDLAAVPQDIQAHLARDPRLASVLQRHPGLRVPGAWDRFELCVRAVLGQQVSVAAARTLATRLVQRCGPALPGFGDEARLFPQAPHIATAELDGLGITGARIRSLKALAQAVCSGALNLNEADPAHIDQALATLPGFGPWTRAYIAMRALNDPDVLPAQDIVLRKAIGQSGAAVSAQVLEYEAQAWRPWRSYAVMAVWLGSN